MNGTGCPDEAAIERGRWLFAQECRFAAGAASIAALPPPDRVEIAFAGRSNVGKSSLVNALTGRRTLARTSNTPGRTQQLNFFDLGGLLTLVDLPGYGFAQVSKTKVKAWTGVVRAYLRGRVTLRRVCLLVDARHGLKPSDAEIMRLLDEAAVGYQAVLTKCDRLSAAELHDREAAMRADLAGHTAAHPELIATSALTGAGIPLLRARLAALAPRSGRPDHDRMPADPPPG